MATSLRPAGTKNSEVAIQWFARARYLALPILLQLCAAHVAEAQTIGWWRFDEGTPGTPANVPNSIVDSSMGNNGTPFGSPVYGETQDPCATLGLTFNGINQRIAIVDQTVYADLRSMTAEAIFSTSGYSPSPFGFNQILFRGDDRGGLDPFFVALQSNGRIGFYIYNVLIVQSPAPIATNTMIHVAATLDDSTGQVNLYINRELVATATTTRRPNGVLTGPLPGLGIGNVFSSNFAQYFEGTIYEVRLSNTAVGTAYFLTAPPSVASDPANEAVCPSATATFSITAFGTGPFTYQWQVNTDTPGGGSPHWCNLTDLQPGGGCLGNGGSPPGSSHALFFGVMDATLSISNLSAIDARAYRCVVTNACGSVTSNEATLTICPADFNCDGTLNSADFFDFITAFFTDAPAADFNADGIINSQDFFDFLAAFFGGCA